MQININDYIKSRAGRGKRTLKMKVMAVLIFLVACCTIVSAKPTINAPDEIQDDSPPAVLPDWSDFQKQMNATFSKALGDMVQSFQRLNMTSMAKQLMRNEPKLTFEGISRLEIPMGDVFPAFNKITDQIPGLNIFKP